ncbi:MAG: tripartite tricarboxylate transporter TctB family protein [Desulfobacterota bacterium]|nr:tripartite tricarboxylate transporter TctB family protein [Thermodesulfobacteriota bacterium]
MKKDEILVGIAIFLFGAITTILSLRMPIGTFRMAGTGLFPLCLGLLLMALSSAFIAKQILLQRKTPPAEGAPPKGSVATKQMTLFLGAMALAILLFDPLGYPLTAFLLMMALLRILGMKRWTFNVLLSLVTACVSYLLFVQWLKIPMPKGWIGL